MNLFSDLPDGVCRQNVPLAPLTWFQLGGPADYLIEPRTEAQLVTVVRRCHESGTALRVLGLGANILVPDEGVRGVVIRLTKGELSRAVFEGEHVIAGGGHDMSKLVNACVGGGLAGLEQLAGIPGTVGGGITMNCGGRYGEIASAVVRVRVVDGDGLVRSRTKDELKFAYRHSAVGSDIVLSAAFRLVPTDPVALRTRWREIWEYKQSTQPALGAPSAGCIFRNPSGHSAGQLIDRAGLKGYRVGSAFVSERHANFAIADRGGRASDVRELISTIIDRVAAHSGIMLEPEVKIW
ncbi:MAG: UDP-N-acetylmuramate dehydrogenase [Phycisphaerae bacterium]|nr:UDP-N-acetylmuramate dehydrogenase [Phycisphaerae bacterium]